MKQTAVEWLENEFKESHKMFGGIDTNWIKRFEQAKEMEKEQIIEFADEYGTYLLQGGTMSAVTYNETYESKTNI